MASETTAASDRQASSGAAHQAVLYRMVTDDHICPFGLKAKHLLEREGFDVRDNWLKNRQQTDAFQRRYDVDTTPQVFINGKRIGGYDQLRKHLDKEPEGPQGTTYVPVLSVFAIAALCAFAIIYRLTGSLPLSVSVESVVALSMTILALQKLRDLTSFTNQFITYDLLGMRWIPYAYAYPFAEAFAGIGMLGGLLPVATAPVALTIGTIGAVSVAKAVYVDKRELRCACVGGDSQVPLGFVSLTENLAMMGMGLWTFYKLWG